MSKKRKQASANEASKTGEAEESAECENRRGRTVAAVFGKAILSGVKIPLEWNHNKVPIGENRDIFSSYIVVVREKVNINYRDWEEVPKEVIDDLFKFIMRGFIVPEERRNYVLGRASIRWRASIRHEQRQKLATVPVVKKCLQNCEIIVGRKLREGSSQTLDSLYHGINDSAQFDPIRRAVFLFPGTELMPSIEINEWRSSLNSTCTNGIVLIVFDGTWKHAKEMMFASLPFISKFATRVCFDCDFEVGGGTIYDSDLILKKEPFKGCMSTMEAVARALRVLEPSGGEIEAKLVEVLKSMVSLQACYLKTVKPRKKC